VIYPIKTIGQLPLILKGFRKEKGLTQAGMAERLGITQQSYAHFEANPASATLERIFMVLRMLDVEISLNQTSPATRKGATPSVKAARKRLSGQGCWAKDQQATQRRSNQEGKAARRCQSGPYCRTNKKERKLVSMGRRAKAQRLNIWMNGIPVGYWETTRQGERLEYSDEWLADEQSRPLSLSLPFLPGNAPYIGLVVTNYFDNLLPDNDAIRRRLAQRHLAGGTDAFQLLEKLGRDCVGAIQLIPADEVPLDVYEINGEVLNVEGVAQRLRNVTSTHALGQDDHDEDLRLSIAGAQEKTALLRHQGHWLLPHGSTPTTHIFKLPMGLVGHMQADMRTSVENEWLCSKILAAYEIPIARCEIAQFEEQKALVVERFDRTPSSDGSWIIRLPQEDMCQATGTSPLHKYQSDGGPGIARIMELLLGSNDAERDRNHFFKTQIIFWVLAATDGHGKNFSIAHLPGGSYRATPIYDVLSAHPVIGKGKNKISPHKAKLAMAVRGSTHHYLIEMVQRRHWIAQAQQVGLGAAAAEQLIDEVVASTESVIDEVGRLLPDDFPMDVAEAIFSGMSSQSAKLADD